MERPRLSILEKNRDPFQIKNRICCMLEALLLKLIVKLKKKKMYTHLCLMKIHNDMTSDIIDIRHPTISINPVFKAMSSFR